MATEATAEWRVSPLPEGNDEIADTAAPNGSSITPPPSLEEQIFQRLLERLQGMGMGVATAPAPPTAPPSEQGQEEPQWQTDDQTWHSWWGTNAQHWSWEQTDPTWSGWKQQDEKWDRPYISHLDFPKFDGRKEEFSNYKYVVMNLKSQCASKGLQIYCPQLDLQLHRCHE